MRRRRVVRLFWGLFPITVIGLLLWMVGAVLHAVWKDPLMGALILACVFVAIPACMLLQLLDNWTQRRRRLRQRRGFDVIQHRDDVSN